jgi:thioredoxin 1
MYHEAPAMPVKTLTAAELEREVLQARGPVALDFYQASCAPCRALEPRLQRIARAFEGRLRVYRVDLDRDQGVAERFGIMSIPTVLVFSVGLRGCAPGRI